MLRFIKTLCIKCGKENCEKVPDGRWISEWEGCIREVSELDANKYFYYKVEMKDQRHRAGIDSPLWKDYDQFIEYIEAKPAGERWKKKHI